MCITNNNTDFQYSAVIIYIYTTFIAKKYKLT